MNWPLVQALALLSLAQDSWNRLEHLSDPACRRRDNRDYNNFSVFVFPIRMWCTRQWSLNLWLLLQYFWKDPRSHDVNPLHLDVAWLHPAVASKPEKTASFGVGGVSNSHDGSTPLISQIKTATAGLFPISARPGGSRPPSSKITADAQLSNPLLIPHTHRHTHTELKKSWEDQQCYAALNFPQEEKLW